MPIPKVIFIKPNYASHESLINDEEELDMFTLDLLLSSADQEEEDEMELALRKKSSCSSNQGSSAAFSHKSKLQGKNDSSRL